VQDYRQPVRGSVRTLVEAAMKSTTPPDNAVPGRAVPMLVLATVGFAVNFWAWALLSPLGPRFKELLSLSGSQQALLVAVPVLVGSLGRIPVGALTDLSTKLDSILVELRQGMTDLNSKVAALQADISALPR